MNRYIIALNNLPTKNLLKKLTNQTKKIKNISCDEIPCKTPILCSINIPLILATRKRNPNAIKDLSRNLH